MTGQGWLDREWSSAPLTADQDGWDWFALHLDDGAQADGLPPARTATRPAYLAGTLHRRRTAPRRRSAPSEIAPSRTATAEVAGRRLPVALARSRCPDHGIAVDIEPLNAQSWMGTTYAYWEGPIRFTGSHAGRRLPRADGILRCRPRSTKA